ncbi:unnamed protein product, partial [Ectocarpus sp. 12 AP-2014]
EGPTDGSNGGRSMDGRRDGSSWPPAIPGLSRRRKRPNDGRNPRPVQRWRWRRWAAVRPHGPRGWREHGTVTDVPWSSRCDDRERDGGGGVPRPRLARKRAWSAGGRER